MKEADLRFENFVDDAAAWVQKLEQDPRFSTVTVLGHSEGSLIGMLAAREAGADAFVSIAGIARPASQLLRDQLRPQLPPELWQQSERILAGVGGRQNRGLRSAHAACALPAKRAALRDLMVPV